MTYKEIQDLIKLVSKSELSEIKVKNGDFELTIRNKNYLKGSLSSGVTPMIAPALVPAAAPSVAPAVASATDTSTEKAAEGAPAKAEEMKTELLEVKSPIVGTFYRAPSPDKAPYVQVGDTISEGSVVCIVEAMKLFNEIESEVSGKIVKVLVEEASPVEYDQVLFLVDPAG